ncbi:E3 ubiquitin-protein ligase SGR9, amyloplastic-like [Prosopis cineraria]|uniref:E3 ubiquitin-protein ligase SGR9, amyloplastic-like n=1 Tax=Prosopis cineraria TaxID=364024 RepID=UPI00240EF533|nr:E3 ubiquitin-protein ligase SGR9, amyloplastic-like [Prosopis cineraria]
MEETATILAALSALPPPHLSDLIHSIASVVHHHHLRLASVLSSQSLFSLALHYLHSLSLPQKSLLIARHLLSFLHILTRHLQPPPPPLSALTRQRDLDAVLLLLLFCDAHQHHPQALETPVCNWRRNLSRLFSDKLLGMSSTFIGECSAAILIPCIEMVIRCRRLVGSMDCGGGKGGGEVAASRAAVVALPRVEVRAGGRECVICKEEMRVGRDVCELPCQHVFHWNCILPWLSKKNTCPCCRFRLPSDDVLREIQRLWEVLVKTCGAELGD